MYKHCTQSWSSSWDSDLSSVLLLLHLIPPSAQGRKRPGKVSGSQAEKHLVVFKKTGTSIQEHLDAITTSLDKNAIPCRHILCLAHHTTPCSTTCTRSFKPQHNIDVGKVKECPCVAEVRARKHLNTKHTEYTDQQFDTVHLNSAGQVTANVDEAATTSVTANVDQGANNI
ncbi:hypothetical protein N1851_002374 [Merluccius polli]|uniref:Uncharacterized protein n=1 Tax=Merluccius polli TaxID=89951 RepID=A0AA47NA60_MERPO|nr:hypothetical protein N1851_002374 [Merluccius polli]